MLRVIIQLPAVLNIAIGVIVLAGWIFDLSLLKSVVPGAVQMKANAAVGLVMAGCALFILSFRPRLSLQRLAQTLALTVVALGLATLGQYLFGWNLGIDELLFADDAKAHNALPGRMSPFSAGAFAGIGLALAALPRPSLRSLVWFGAVPVITIGTISIVGYLWNARELATDHLVAPVAIHTAMAFILLGAGTLLARSLYGAQFDVWRMSFKSVQFKIMAGFMVALILLVITGGLAYKETLAFKSSARLVAKAQEVRATLGQIYGSVSDAESTQRDYLITGKPQELAKLTGFRLQVQKQWETLARLLLDNPAQLSNAEELGREIDRRLDLLAAAVAIYQKEGFAAARSLVADGEGVESMMAVEALVKYMDDAEAMLVAEREAKLTQSGQRTLAGLLVTLLAAAFGLLILCHAILREISLRNKSEQELANMTESLPGAVYRRRLSTDGSSRFEFLSEAVIELLGIKRIALLQDSKQFWNVVVEDCKPNFMAALQKAARTLEPQEHDFRIRHPVDGRIRWIRSSATLHKDADGSIVWNGYWIDITEQQQLQLEVQEARQAADTANRAKSTFLATMSHEIRTPMNGVLGMLELLSMTKLDGEQRTTLEVVRESGKSLLRIIDDILDFSKVEAGKLVLSPEATSIQEVIEGVRNMYSGIASSKGLPIKLSVDPQISPALLVDPVRLRQILNNFVSNALKFTSRGWIEVKAELVEKLNEEDRVQFSVTDTGIGISAEDQQKLFQPFSQAQGNMALHVGGTGLGLMICRRLASLMGGTVDMVSAPGKGTTMIFAVSLPIADPKDLKSTHTESMQLELESDPRLRRMVPSASEAEAEGTLALLVDDHPINREIILRQVQTLGYAAESAENGVEALLKWQSGRFGIIITDCNMPEMDGYALTRRIRDLEFAIGGKRTPIIACTANALNGVAQSCFAAGMDDCLIKPVNLKDLLSKLNQWLPIPAEDIPSGSSAGAQSEAHLQNVGITPPVDRLILAEITGGDTAVERDILMDFRRVNDEDAAMLKRAVAEKDLYQVTRAAHRIKGASRMVGAVVLANVCERIEEASRIKDWNTIEPGMGAFYSEWRRLNTYLNSI